MIDIKSPWVIGAGVVLGVVLLARKPAAAPSGADVSLNSLEASTQQNMVLGAQSIGAETERQKTAADLNTAAIGARAAIALQEINTSTALKMQQQANAASLRSEQLAVSAQVTGQSIPLLSGLIQAGMGKAVTLNDRKTDFVKSYVVGEQQERQLQTGIRGGVDITGIATRSAEINAKNAANRDIAINKIQADVAKTQISAWKDVEKYRAKTALDANNSNAMVGGLSNLFDNVAKIFGG